MTTEETATARLPALRAPTADALDGLKVRQGATWPACDDSIAAMLDVVGESLCEVVNLRAGWKVLDIAGNGTCSIAAARQGCEVTAIDAVPARLEHRHRRAAAERLSIRFQQGHAGALPFAAGTFDVVLSMFGVMFAPNPVRAASELLRVCRHYGRIGLANWAPHGFMGRLFTVVASYSTPPAGLARATLWGLDDHLDRLFRTSASDLHMNHRDFVFRCCSPEVFVNALLTLDGPVRRAFADLSAQAQRQLEQDLLYLVDDSNMSSNSTVVLPSEYVEVVVLKK